MIDDVQQAEHSFDDWRPTCELHVLSVRAVLLSSIRRFFQQRNYLEVETPVLSHDIVIDAHLDPLAVQQQDSHATTTEPASLYLQTSPEAGMKRLLAAGCRSMFQVTRSFRAGESGRLHNPEFTMIEWYGRDSSYHDQMQLTADLIRYAADKLSASAKEIGLPSAEQAALQSSMLRDAAYQKTSYRDAFLSAAATDPLAASDQELRELCRQQQLTDAGTSSIARDELLNLLLAANVEPVLGQDRGEFLFDYPVSQAALAERNPDDPRTACRFELYAGGVELCNGYQELTDAAELARRDAVENERRELHRCDQLPGAPRLHQAMQHGLPRCSGVALGFDRLVMCLLGKTQLQDVIPFPIDRA